MCVCRWGTCTRCLETWAGGDWQVQWMGPAVCMEGGLPEEGRTKTKKKRETDSSRVACCGCLPILLRFVPQFMTQLKRQYLSRRTESSGNSPVRGQPACWGGDGGGGRTDVSATAVVVVDDRSAAGLVADARACAHRERASGSAVPLPWRPPTQTWVGGRWPLLPAAGVRAPRPRRLPAALCAVCCPIYLGPWLLYPAQHSTPLTQTTRGKASTAAPCSSSPFQTTLLCPHFVRIQILNDLNEQRRRPGQAPLP